VPKRQELFSFLSGEHNVGVLLVSQMGGAPEEIQLIVQTATYDESVGGLRERQAYLLRLLGVKEHRVSLGVFNDAFLASEHPILHHHNAPTKRIDFTGTPSDPNELVLDIQAAYSATFGPWRDLAEDINREAPLFDLLQQGAGTLGTMPAPAAERMVKVFAHHDMSSTLAEVEGARRTADDEKAAAFETQLKLLAMDDSYFVVYDIAVDEMNVGR